MNRHGDIVRMKMINKNLAGAVLPSLSRSNPLFLPRFLSKNQFPLFGKHSNIVLTMSMLLILSTAATADIITLPAQGPVPQIHPFAATTRIPSPFQDVITTATIAPGTPSPTQVAPSSRLKQALATIDKKQFVSALALRDQMKVGSPERLLVNWLLATANTPEITAMQISAMIGELQNWPGQARLRQTFERALARENHPDEQVIALLNNQEPQTVAGMVTLANALAKTGQMPQARTLIKPWWHKAKLTRGEEKYVLDRLTPNLLSKQDHLNRMKRMLYDYRLDSAEHMSHLADARSLYLAGAAVARQEKNAPQKLAQIDKSWKKDPLVTFAHIQYLRRAGQYDAAAKLMLKAPKDAASLIHPDIWWVERRALSREMLDLGKYKLAYQLAKDHAARSPMHVADAEFHAGWYALRFLKDAKTAKGHFVKIIQISSGSTSQARGFYWLGRTYEALREPQATHDAYTQAARFTTSYYGQLAAKKLGQASLNIPYLRPTPQERDRFAKIPAVQAIHLLYATENKDRAEVLSRELGQSLKSPGDLALLTAMVEKQGNHHLSLKIGKEAAARGLDVGALTHPLGAISANIPLNDKALAYAIARQESEFNPKAQSGAGARGLLQLMPKTAKSVAKAQKITYSLEKLSQDGAYNTTLGSYFIHDQLARFNGSYILTFIGYNAGSGRVRDWISRYGDPRGKHVDNVVDWIERIPFTETRNYVQRVMENYQIYQARLHGAPDIVRDLTL